VDIEESIHIDAGPEEVWRQVTDNRRHPEFAGPRSITKVIDFDGPLAPGAWWVAHERFGPQKFDAPSEVTEVDPGHRLAWVSFPPMKDANRGEGGRVLWSYTVEREDGGSRLVHRMQVLPPAKGAAALKAMYAVIRLPGKQRQGILTSLSAIKRAAESAAG
jgi:uncharacterized protein YndB with AHSA1/START domain